MLKTAYNWALEEELLLVNPALRVKNPPALRPKTRPVWSMEEIASTVINGTGSRLRIDPHLPIHGLRDSFGTWVYETYGVKQAQEWLGLSDPATTLRHYVRLTTAARAKAVAGLDEITRTALDAAEERAVQNATQVRDNVVALAGRRR